MTKEELREHCEKQVKACEMWAKTRGEEPSGKVYEEHKLILELLEQQPSDNCVSRQSILEELNRLGRHAFKDDTDYDCLFDFVDRLPPVMPTRKSGLRWIERFDNEDKWLECPHCHKDSDNAYAYCPNCGASFKEEKRGNLDGSN